MDCRFVDDHSERSVSLFEVNLIFGLRRFAKFPNKLLHKSSRDGIKFWFSGRSSGANACVYVLP